MDYEQFLEQVKADLQEQFSYMNVEIRSVEKLQGQSYTGISITPEGSNAGATMNLYSQYEMLQDGVPMDIVMRRIENLAADAVNQIPQVEASTLSDYEQMKHTLIMQAVPVGPNRALLETIPHRTMEDIAIVYRFQLEHRENADATVLVTNQMLQNYGITAEQLMADAAISAPQRNPVSLRSLAEVLSEMSGGMIPPEDVGAPPLMVATVPGAVNGAGVMGYPDFFKDAAEQIGGSYFILPSSVHEILLLADDGSMSAQELSAMVSAVNSQEVKPEEQLGSEAYHYDAQAQVFEKASAYEERIMEDREMIADAMPGVIHEESAAYTAEQVQETISVLMVEPGKYPREIEIGTELEDLQAAVGGNIEVVYPFDDQVGLVMNEEGKINGLPLNRALQDEKGNLVDVIAGPFMVVGLTEESFGSLTQEQMKTYGDKFHTPQMFMKMDRGFMALPIPEEKIEKADKAPDKSPAKDTQKKEPKAKRRKTPDHSDR